VADQLTRHPTGAGQACAVDHVVQPGLEDAQQVLARLAGDAVGLFVVAAELLLHHAVVKRAFCFSCSCWRIRSLDARAAVLAWRVGALLERLIAADEVDAEAARLAGSGSV